jgi:hypothetical protein
MQGGTAATSMLMSAIASDLSMSGMCDKCIKKDSTARACDPVCAGVQAVLPSARIPTAFARARIAPIAERQFKGAATPPDPPPPKPSVLA